jgi:phosphatidylserine/phosphatidylglycerophosphate/cardiolipin synthase-like enzyme
MSRRKRTSKTSLGGLLLIVVLVSLAYIMDVAFDIDILGQPDPVVVTTTGEGEWYDIYFTDPTCPPQEERRGGVDEIIADDLRQAELRVDVAAFDLDAEPIVDVLVTLHEQGVEVRVVTDSDNADLPSIGRLRNSGVPVVEDQRSALMHNKFVVVDGRFVWTGSLNYTSNGAYCNNNNAIRIDSPELAANYTAEMDEMFLDGGFGPTSPPNTPNEQLDFNGVLVENYFAPEKELAPLMAQAIENAQEEIRFMAFVFTNEQIGEAMLGRARAGISVSGVFETTGSTTDFSYYPPMRDAGLSNLQVRQDGNNRIMHHKVILIDGQTVILGSFNFSASANDSNDENILIVHDPIFTSFFLEEFDAVWAEAK